MPTWSELEVFFNQPFTVTNGHVTAFLVFGGVLTLLLMSDLSRLYRRVRDLEVRNEVSRLAGRR